MNKCITRRKNVIESILAMVKSQVCELGLLLNVIEGL